MLMASLIILTKFLHCKKFLSMQLMQQHSYSLTSSWFGIPTEKACFHLLTPRILLNLKYVIIQTLLFAGATLQTPLSVSLCPKFVWKVSTKPLLRTGCGCTCIHYEYGVVQLGPNSFFWVLQLPQLLFENHTSLYITWWVPLSVLQPRSGFAFRLAINYVLPSKGLTDLERTSCLGARISTSVPVRW